MTPGEPPSSGIAASAPPGTIAPGAIVVRPSRFEGVLASLRAHLHPLTVLLVPVLALAALLNLNHLSRNGYANVFYSAAVRSELQSLHNFLFLSSDPSGYISVDKTPLAVWVQVASAKVFGFSPGALLGPEAALGLLSVALMYGVVARRFGRLAGLTGALALAVFPSFVAVSRDNTPDPLLIFLMLGGAGAAVRAAETSRLRWLLVSALAVGLAFEAKGLAALLVVPGIVVAWLVCTDLVWWRRVAHLAVAVVVLAVVSFAWIAYVDWTPKSSRPYVGGSTNNTEWNLTFQYNGVGRVGGQVGGPGRVPHVKPLPTRALRNLNPVPKIPRVGHARYPTAFGGPPRVGRLFGVGLGDQGGWYLPFAAIGLLSVGFMLVRGRGRGGGASADAEGAAAGARGASAWWQTLRDPRLAFLIVMGGWFAVEAVVLSLSKGIVHPYYVSALGPGAAAMAGAGVCAMASLVRERRWLVVVPALAVAATCAVELMLLRREHWHEAIVAPVAAAAFLALVAMVVWRRRAYVWMALSLAALLVVPAVYAATAWQVPVEGTFPAAGPHVAAGHGGVGVAGHSLATNQALLAYVRSHGPGSRLDVFTLSSDAAAPLTLMGGRAAAIGGYSGTDPALDGPGLARMVAAGQVRYLFLGGPYSERGGNRASQAAEHLCPHVQSRVWMGVGRPEPPLFDCAGRAQALATLGSHCPDACPPVAGRGATGTPGAVVGRGSARRRPGTAGPGAAGLAGAAGLSGAGPHPRGSAARRARLRALRRRRLGLGLRPASGLPSHP